MISFLPSLGTWGPCFLSTVAMPRKPCCASDLRMGLVCDLSPASSPGTDYSFSRGEAPWVISVPTFCLCGLCAPLPSLPAVFCCLGSRDLTLSEESGNLDGGGPVSSIGSTQPLHAYALSYGCYLESPSSGVGMSSFLQASLLPL